MSTEKRIDGPSEEVPIRENLFTKPSGSDDEPKLICSRCKECGSTFFPKEEMCPVCIKEGTLDTVKVSGKGKLLSFTRVWRGLPGFDSPYAMGCIEIDEGPVLIAQLQDWQDVELKIGMPVQLVIGKIKQGKDWKTFIGPKFKPLPK
jgi:hypothetical protein